MVSEAIRAFTIASFECRVVPGGVAAYEPQSLYSSLPPEETAAWIPARPDRAT